MLPVCALFCAGDRRSSRPLTVSSVIGVYRLARAITFPVHLPAEQQLQPSLQRCAKDAVCWGFVCDLELLVPRASALLNVSLSSPVIIILPAFIHHVSTASAEFHRLVLLLFPRLGAGAHWFLACLSEKQFLSVFHSANASSSIAFLCYRKICLEFFIVSFSVSALRQSVSFTSYASTSSSNVASILSSLLSWSSSLLTPLMCSVVSDPVCPVNSNLLAISLRWPPVAHCSHLIILHNIVVCMEVLSLPSFTDALILRRCSSPGDPVSFCSSAELATDSGPDSDYFSIVSSEESADSCSDVELGDSGTLIARALYLSSCPEDIIWPREWPLPLPLWSPAPECLCVASCDALRQFVARLDRLLLQHLREYTYDSVDVWLRFWRAFSDWRASGECGDVGAEFADWRRTFRVPGDSDSLTCAGLSYKFLDHLAAVDPLAARHFYTVSVEESVEFPLVYTSNCCPPLCNENDHVLLACRLTVTESGAARHGVLLVDSGLHVSRTVVVMQDGLSPHTGQFTVGSISAALYHNYQLSDNGLFVYNTITKQRTGCLASSSVSCMFIGGRFESAFSFAEHRSVFYPVHAIVRRSRRGHPCAGVYFDAAATNTAPSLTLFYSADASDDSPAAVTKRRVSLAAAARPAGGHTVVEHPAGECSVSHCDAPCVDQQHQEAIVAVCRQMGVSVRHFELLVRQVTPALLDTQFRQLLSDANLQILDISKNN